MSFLFPPRPDEFKFSEAKSPRLRFVTYSDGTRTIILRGITKTGLLHHTFATNSNRTANTETIPITEIPLSITLNTTATGVQRGELYVQVFLEFANVPGALLTADYITTAQPLAWPVSNIHDSTHVGGSILNVGGSNPGAGNEIAEAVPTNTIWTLLGVRFLFTTDANVAAREPIIVVRNTNNDPIFFSRPTTTQAASLAIHHTHANYNVAPATYTTRMAATMPNIVLSKGADIITETTNIQAGDAFTSIRLTIIQSLSP